MAFLVNTDVQPKIPQDWSDLLGSRLQRSGGTLGDPRASSQAILAVYAAALANGDGSLETPGPGWTSSPN